MSNVIVYTTSTCPHCKTAKDYLNSKGVKYTEKNVSVDKSAQMEMSQMGIMGVPALNVNGDIIVGFDRVKIDKALKNKIIKCPECETKLRVPLDKGKLKITCKKCSHEFVTS